MTISIDDMAVFAKKKGFVYPTSEIYGGIAGFFDYGYLGVELKNNIKAEWWKTFVQQREDIVGIDGSLITHPNVWKASGHLDSFQDIMLMCSKCKKRFRADTFIEEKLKIQAEGLSTDEINSLIKKNKLKCPDCGSNFEEVKHFSLMFGTSVGAETGKESVAYLRPETAQQIFTNFKLVQENSRMKLPFGIAQIGRALRNEISPRDFLFRCREFEMMEIEYFIHPDKVECPFIKEVFNDKMLVYSEGMQKKKTKAVELSVKQILDKKIISNKWLLYFLALAHKWFIDLGCNPDNFRIRQHLSEELSHYAKETWDLEYNFPFGWKELQGVANRTDYDLKQHIKFSKQDLSLYDEETKKKVVPYVIEPSQGVDRAFLVFLFDAYNYDKKRGNIVLKLNPKLAPIKVGVFPLVNKLDKEARTVYDLLKKSFVCQYDKSGSIGRRYARADEIGIPYCVTVDFDSLRRDDVTVRNRDNTKQIRVKQKDLIDVLNKLINQEIEFNKAGKLI